MSKFSVERVFETMIRVQASDAYLVPGRPPTLRIDGRIRSLEAPVLSADDLAEVIRAVAPERSREQLAKCGRAVFAFPYTDRRRIRAHAEQHLDGASLTLRFIPPEPPGLDELGVPPVVRALCRRPRGVLLVVGPGGSGSTTVLAAMLDYVNRNFDRRIVTLEEPIEFVHSSEKSIVTQREVGIHVEDYESGIRSLRGGGVDVLTASELRSEGAIRAAVEAGNTDCLVIAYVRERGVRNAIERLFAASGGVSAGRWRSIVSAALLAVLYRELCARITTGRIAAHEFLVNTPAVSKLLQDDEMAHIDTAMQTGKKYGMQLLDEHLYRMVREGTITADEALDKARDPAALMTKLESDDRDGPGRGPLSSPFPVRPEGLPPDLSEHAEPDD